MKQSSNLGLALYDKTDLMNITGLENSLNHNMELIDSEINQLSKNKAPAGYGGFGEKIPHGGRFSDDSSFVTWLTNQINSIPSGSSKQIRFALDQEYSPYPVIFSGGDLYGVLTNEQGYGTLVVYSYSMYRAGLVFQMVRNFYENVWQPWEWVNPPMLLGVEYRTTERYKGKPVYVKAVDFGALPNTTTKHVDIDNKNHARAIRVSGLLNNGATIPGTDESQTNGSKPLQCYGYNNNVCIYAPYDASSKTAVVTAWYTKTTD